MAKGIEKSGAMQRMWKPALKAAAMASVIMATLSGCASVPADQGELQTANANWCYAPGPDANCRPIIEVGNWH